MELEFKIGKENKEVIILGDGKEIGHIFTPSGTLHDTPNSIQVCGFDNAFDLWGCGIFSDENGIQKKDIQLMFNSNSRKGGANKVGECWKCFNKPCTCNDLRIKTLEEVLEEKI